MGQTKGLICVCSIMNVFLGCILAIIALSTGCCEQYDCYDYAGSPKCCRGHNKCNNDCRLVSDEPDTTTVDGEAAEGYYESCAADPDFCTPTTNQLKSCGTWSLLFFGGTVIALIGASLAVVFCCYDPCCSSPDKKKKR